jgi:hypothetical protein
VIRRVCIDGQITGTSMLSRSDIKIVEYKEWTKSNFGAVTPGAYLRGVRIGTKIINRLNIVNFYTIDVPAVFYTVFIQYLLYRYPFRSLYDTVLYAVYVYYMMGGAAVTVHG